MSADNLDIAAEREEHARSIAIAMRKPGGPLAMGRCHYCDSVTAAGLRWCDAVCRDDWSSENR